MKVSLTRTRVADGCKQAIHEQIFDFQIAPAAFNDPDKYIYSTETLIDVQDIQEFFNDHISQAKYKGYYFNFIGFP